MLFGSRKAFESPAPGVAVPATLPPLLPAVEAPLGPVVPAPGVRSSTGAPESGVCVLAQPASNAANNALITNLFMASPVSCRCLLVERFGNDDRAS